MVGSQFNRDAKDVHLPDGLVIHYRHVCIAKVLQLIFALANRRLRSPSLPMIIGEEGWGEVVLISLLIYLLVKTPLPSPLPALRRGARGPESLVGHAGEGFALEMCLRRLGTVPVTAVL